MAMVPIKLSALAVLVAVALLFCYQSWSGSAGDSVIDGIRFPTELRASGATQKLCGGGTRLKYNVVKVYAVGLYFEPQAVARGSGTDSLKPYAALPSSELVKSKGFYEVLVGGKFAKSLLLQFHRSVGADAIAGALKDALAKKVSAGSLEKFSKELGRCLGSSSIPLGGKLSFHCKSDVMQIAFGALHARSLD
ncbi:MAG: hypothetical protein SGPRY_000239 [Prymnesium sp.]